MRKILLLLFIAISLGTFAQVHPCTPPVVTLSGTNWKCRGVRDTLTVSGPGGTTYLWDNGQTTTSIFTNPIDGDSTFYVIATNGGCSDTTYFMVTLRNAPAVVLTPSVVCNGIQTCITANATGTNSPFSYLWNNGKTSDSICTTPTDSSGDYIVTVSNGCKTTKGVFSTNCTGVNDIAESSCYDIYPNPSTTVFNITLDKKALLNVCDITGRVLFSEMKNPGVITFGKQLNPGLYFLFINGKPAGKIVKL